MSAILHIVESPDLLAARVSRSLSGRIVDLQSDPSRTVQLCLTGGTIATKIMERLAGDLVASKVATDRLELWWGDERFVAADSADRNGEPAMRLLAPVGLPPESVHLMPASDGRSLSEGVEAYATELGHVRFDICLLGLGPDGHVASLFPEHPSSEPTDATVIGVTNSPKPPPERISLTLPVINASAEVWFLISGADKAPAAARAYRPDPTIPGGQVAAAEVTHYWLDEAAAAEITD